VECGGGEEVEDPHPTTRKKASKSMSRWRRDDVEVMMDAPFEVHALELLWLTRIQQTLDERGPFVEFT
jgi:hypothetical protein